MIGKQDRWQGELFMLGSLSDVVPRDHILRRVDKVLDLSWLRGEVEKLYDVRQGRPGIDPEAAVRLMLAGFFQGIVHDRKLMREAQVNLAIRWFAGYRLHETLPEHSSLTRIRRRWGEERFKRIFEKTVEQCVRAGLVSAETVHIDATLIRADVSWDSLVARHERQVIAENQLPEEQPESDEPPSAKAPHEKAPKAKKMSPTDPDATMTTSSHGYHLEPSYKQHTAVDDQAGIVVDVAVTTGETSEGTQLLAQVQRLEARLKRPVATVTADAGYAHSRNYQQLEAQGKNAVIPPPREGQRPSAVPLSRFKYDGKNHLVRCPGGKLLRRGGRTAKGWYYRARSCDCRACPLRAQCVPPTAKVRTLMIADGYESLLRARRKRRHWSDADREHYRRHRWRVEGAHGEAKTQHGLRRATRRGLWNVAIQAYLTAAVMNLKRLAALVFAHFCRCWLTMIGLQWRMTAKHLIGAIAENIFPRTAAASTL
jgi:transposase